MTRLVPAEWAPHRAMWLGFPSHAELWEENLEAAQAEVAGLARALAGPGGERVRGGPGPEAEAREEDAHGVAGVESCRRFGDICCANRSDRRRGGRARIAEHFASRWGRKYELEVRDGGRAGRRRRGEPLYSTTYLEGGVAHDGCGRC